MNYEEIIAEYQLDILKGGGDLQITSDGNIKATLDGDAQLGSTEFNAMFRLARNWELQSPTLEQLFEIVLKAPERERELVNEANEVANKVAEGIANKVMNRGEADGAPPPSLIHQMRNKIDAHNLGRDIYAGAAMVVICNMLQLFRKDLNLQGNVWRKSPPFVTNWSFAAIAEASGNSFRHDDEWRIEWVQRRKFTSKQRNSLEVLKDAFGIEKEFLLTRNMCANALMLLSGGTFKCLGKGLFDFAKAWT